MRRRVHAQKCELMRSAVSGLTDMIALLRWDRAVGWYVMALVDVLDYWPQWHPGRAVVLGYLKSIAPRLVAAIEPKSGIWWLVMSQPGRAGNRLESSAASMFVYGFLKAVRKGYLTGTIYKPVAKRAYEYLVNNYIVKETDGTLGWEGTVLVGALDTPGDFDVSCYCCCCLFLF